MSSPAPVFEGTVNERGNLVLRRPYDFRKHLKRLREKPIEVVVRRRRSQRSLEQNSYWWAVPVPLMAEYMGEDRTSTHYALLGECFGYHHNERLGVMVPNKGSSSALTVEEFSHLIEWCPPWAFHNHGVRIPLPNEVDYYEHDIQEAR